MKIVEGFMFYNELKMLKLKLEELYEEIDYFIVVEATKSVSGLDKVMYFEDNKHLFEKYSDKIIHVVVDDMPTTPNDENGSWDREYHQRNAIERGLQQLDLKDQDLVIVTDADEIVSGKLIRRIRNEGKLREEILSLRLDFYYYNLECKSHDNWDLAKIVTYAKYKELGSAQEVRTHKTKKNFIKDAGWHFSYFGGVDNIVDKIKNFSHQEYNKKKYLDKDILDKRIKNLKDVYGRETIKYSKIKIEDNNRLPEHYKILL